VALETRVITQPRPVNPTDPTLFRFCPSCGEESLELNTHLLKSYQPAYGPAFHPSVQGWECTACGRFFTGTYLGISWCDLTQYPTVKE